MNNMQELNNMQEMNTICEACIKPIHISNALDLNKCQFCSDHQGKQYVDFVSVDLNIGFISCSNCIDNMELTSEEWIKNKGHGSANIFQGRNIKVRRSSGDIEDDWHLIMTECYVRIINDEECIACEKINTDIIKYVSIKDIFELNIDNVYT
jgi:hypothetical protein